jgi:hypothetical protein
MSLETFPEEQVPVMTQKLSLTPRFVNGMPMLEGAAIALDIPGMISTSMPLLCAYSNSS